MLPVVMSVVALPKVSSNGNRSHCPSDPNSTHSPGVDMDRERQREVVETRPLDLRSTSLKHRSPETANHSNLNEDNVVQQAVDLWTV